MAKAGRRNEGPKRKVTVYVPEEDAAAFDKAAEEQDLPRPGPLYVAAIRKQARRYRHKTPETEAV